MNGNSKANSKSFAETDDIERLEADIETEAEDVSVSMVSEGGWGWMVVLGSFMINVIATGTLYTYGVYLEDFVDYFESSNGAVGGIGSLMLGAACASGNFGKLESLSYRISLSVCVILGLTVFLDLRLVTDGQTDGRTQDNGIYRTSITSRGKIGGLDSIGVTQSHRR